MNTTCRQIDYSSYELIHETVRIVYKLLKYNIDKFMSEYDIRLLTNISLVLGEKVILRSSKSDLESRLYELGLVIYKLLVK